MKTLICFDINGTLIARDSRTDLPYSQAVDRLLGKENAMEGVDTSARSDQDVFMEILRNHQLTYTEALWKTFLGLYEEALEAWKDTDVWRENADAVSFVHELADSGRYHLALITGELTMGAAYKLGKLGIWHHFPVGGFGEHGLRRFDIAEYAVQAAKSHYGVDAYDEVYVIGDTLLDIRTARHLGAKVVSIATGSNTKEELAAEGPDHLIVRFEEIRLKFL